MDVGNDSGHGAIEATNAENVSVPHLNMTGDPYFGMRFFGMNGLHLGQINLELSGGLGIRFERDEPGSSNVTMDDVFVSGAGNHGVETWNVDGLEIGSVTARDVAYAGLLVNNTRNAHIGLVDGENVATGSGYATFRTANENGNNGDYSTNIEVDQVISRGGGRGIFCVSQSGGVRIGEVDLAGNGNNSILIENCYNYTIAGGTVNGGGEVRIAARSEFPNTRDTNITLTVNNTSVRESPCADNSVWNLSGNGSRNICASRRGRACSSPGSPTSVTSTTCGSHPRSTSCTCSTRRAPRSSTNRSTSRTAIASTAPATARAVSGRS
jgi:hypothetical protein